jgi:mono/diheme cytochrome c family protein
MTALKIALCGAILCAGCSARRGEAIRGPLTNLSADAQSGQRHFMAFCNKCHPFGEGGLAPAINDKPFPDFLKRFQVRHGLGVMPAFDKQELSDQQLNEILAYIRALHRHDNRNAGVRAPTRP